MTQSQLRPGPSGKGPDLEIGKCSTARSYRDDLVDGHRRQVAIDLSKVEGVRVAAGQLVRSLNDGQDGEVLAAAKVLGSALMGAGFDLSVIAATIANPAEPIVVRPAKLSRASKTEPVSIRVRMAEQLTRLVFNPRVDLTTWERNFVDSVVPALRNDMAISEKQAENVARLLKKPRRRLR